MSTQPEEMKDEEIEEGEILTDEEDDDLMDLEVASLMTSLLATEDGDTVCTALVAISQQLQTQNRILIKILTELKA
jgi:hypothetical protein